MKIRINPQSPGRLAQRKIIALNIRTVFFFLGKIKKKRRRLGTVFIIFPCLRPKEENYTRYRKNELLFAFE